jgi:hypothetical protein
MEFFNKKEEVLDVQLTEYGKYLLSQGRMKPAFYAFYDDEILYDIAAGPQGGGTADPAISGSNTQATENQKDTDRRIRYETPNLKAQSNTTGVETRVKQFLKTVETNINKNALTVNSINFADAFENVPQFGQKFFAATDPIGTSDLKSQYDAAWAIMFMNNEISSSQDYYTVNLTSSAATLNNGVIREIPQLDIVLDYKTFYVDDSALPSDSSQWDVIASANDSGIDIALEKGFILIDLQEHNTAYEKENFYMEVYLSGSDTGLVPICPGDVGLARATQDNVDYFLDVSADGEIDLDIAREYRITPRAITRNDGLGGPPPTPNRLDQPLDIYSGPFDTGEDEEPCD